MKLGITPGLHPGIEGSIPSGSTNLKKGKVMECKICGKENERYGLCVKHRSQVRRYRTKLAAVTLLGGKCMKCGYDENIEVLEFHHRNPEEKEFKIGGVINKSWNTIKEEILKCDLLCSNCHRVIHTNDKDEKFLNEVYEYRGNGRIQEIKDLLEQSLQR